MKNHYSTLGVSKDATREEIKKAHRRAAREHHPDAGGDPEAFMAIQTAYDTLADEEKRRRYDNGEPEPQNLTQAALSYICMLFINMLSTASEVMFFQMDIVAKMSAHVASDTQGAKNQVKEWEKKIAFLKKVLTKLSHRGGHPDILIQLLNQQIQEIQRAIFTVKEDIEKFKLASEMLKEYKFEKEEPRNSEYRTVSFADLLSGFNKSNQFYP